MPAGGVIARRAFFCVRVGCLRPRHRQEIPRFWNLFDRKIKNRAPKVRNVAAGPGISKRKAPHRISGDAFSKKSGVRQPRIQNRGGALRLFPKREEVETGI